MTQTRRGLTALGLSLTATLAIALALPLAGCGGGSTSGQVEVSNDVMKKNMDYIQSYQKKMVDQHKVAPKKHR